MGIEIKHSIIKTDYGTTCETNIIINGIAKYTQTSPVRYKYFEGSKTTERKVQFENLCLLRRDFKELR